METIKNQTKAHNQKGRIKHLQIKGNKAGKRRGSQRERK